MNKGFIIAIDGPVAAGKGTIAPDLAKQLEGFYLYTGATYRCLALYGIEHGVDFSDPQSIIAALPNVVIDLGHNKVLLNGVDVTEEIKRVDVARKTPTVAELPEIREAMVRRQQEIAHAQSEQGKIIVIEGRDTATVVFPHAALKVFLTADPEVRAKRRLAQLRAGGNMDISFETVLEDLQNRDEEDTTRSVDPLVKNPAEHGYFIVDDTNNTEPETVGIIVEELKKRGLIT